MYSSASYVSVALCVYMCSRGGESGNSVNHLAAAISLLRCCGCIAAVRLFLAEIKSTWCRSLPPKRCAADHKCFIRKFKGWGRVHKKEVHGGGVWEGRGGGEAGRHRRTSPQLFGDFVETKVLAYVEVQLVQWCGCTLQLQCGTKMHLFGVPVFVGYR